VFISVLDLLQPCRPSLVHARIEGKQGVGQILEYRVQAVIEQREAVFEAGEPPGCILATRKDIRHSLWVFRRIARIAAGDWRAPRSFSAPRTTSETGASVTVSISATVR
jgi:hypothetical protein